MASGRGCMMWDDRLRKVFDAANAEIYSREERHEREVTLTSFAKIRDPFIALLEFKN
jgi:hypothetical protein